MSTKDEAKNLVRNAMRDEWEAKISRLNARIAALEEELAEARKDSTVLANFILGWWPGYEDAIHCLRSRPRPI